MIAELPSLTAFHKKLCQLDLYRDLRDESFNIKSELELRNEDENEVIEPAAEDPTLKEVSLTYSGPN